MHAFLKNKLSIFFRLFNFKKLLLFLFDFLEYLQIATIRHLNTFESVSNSVEKWNMANMHFSITLYDCTDLEKKFSKHFVHPCRINTNTVHTISIIICCRKIISTFSFKWVMHFRKWISIGSMRKYFRISLYEAWHFIY